MEENQSRKFPVDKVRDIMDTNVNINNISSYSLVAMATAAVSSFRSLSRSIKNFYHLKS